jgi:hypothetical protein
MAVMAASERLRVLVARRLFPEVVERLSAHFDVDYRGLTTGSAGWAGCALRVAPAR